MSDEPKPMSSERAATDDGLADERRRTDEELERRAAGVEATADAIVADARERADEVLDLARENADDKLRETGAAADERATVRGERRQEDQILRAERADADKRLSDEREERRRALTALLALEREYTDELLLLERDQADLALSTRDDFLAMASHDLRNMLGGIAMSAASLLMVRGNESIEGEVAREAQRIRRYTARMNRLVGDLLDVVSIDAGALEVVPQARDVTEVVRETVNVFETLSATKRISLRTDLEPGPILALCDDERILQVLANLVGNALKFTPEGGSIDIHVRRCEADIRISVADSGRGIAPESLERVFERFWQSEKRGAGLGLGLYISRCIVEAHGGKIWAESRPSEGTTFHFTLPEAPGPATRRAPASG